MNYNETKQFDVIILGSGIGASTLATILAKHQARVLMIDKATHPRFAIGEAITSHTEALLSVLAHQYSVPELDYLSSFHKMSENISASACGYKRSFGFLYHHEGKEQSPQERIQWGVGHSSHLFRQEIDHYLVQVAVKYGAKLLSKTKYASVDIDEKGIEVKVEGREKFTADYLVDASGYNSILAKKLNLREKPTRFKTHSRSLFTHMTGVRNADNFVQMSIDKKDIISWNQGTLHHIFDGGWMWVIPFNNHERATNSACSVGLNLDTRRFPKTEITPEQEFQNFLSRFPGIAIQFENAKPIRNWVSTDRLQYSSSSCMGERFYILPHATGFIDPIFSAGLIHTFTSISPLGALILEAIANQDFSTKHFVALESLQQKIFDYNDNIANCTYISFRNFNLVNAWLRVWLVQHLMSIWKLGWSQAGLFVEDKKGYKTKDLSRFIKLDYLNNLDPHIERWGNNYVQKAVAEVENVEKGLLSPDEAAHKIVSLLNSASWLFKSMGIGNTSQRSLDILTSKRINYSLIFYLFWQKIFLKKEVRPFDFKIKDFIQVGSIK